MCHDWVSRMYLLYSNQQARQTTKGDTATITSSINIPKRGRNKTLLPQGTVFHNLFHFTHHWSFIREASETKCYATLHRSHWSLSKRHKEALLSILESTTFIWLLQVSETYRRLTSALASPEERFTLCAATYTSPGDGSLGPGTACLQARRCTV